MWEVDGSVYLGPDALSLDLRSSDAQILRVSARLSVSLGVSPSVSDPLSLYDLMSPSESCRWLNSLMKGTSRKLLVVFTSRAKKKQFCFEVLESEILNSGDVVRVLFKDHHKHEKQVQLQGDGRGKGREGREERDEDDDLLSGFSVLLNSGNYKVHRVSPNFTSLLGHSAHAVLGTPLQKWLHPQDESSFSTLKKKESLRFRDAHGAFESFVYFSYEEVTKETCKMNFKVQLKGNEEERIFSTLLQNEFRVRQVCCNNGLQLPNLNHRNFLELVSSPDDLHYLENRIRKKVPGLTRLYEIRMNPKWVLWIQTHFFIYPNNDILAHHFIVKDKEEKSQHTLNQNNNVLKRKWPSGDVEEEDSTTQKNKLLRELLNINYSVQDNLNPSALTTSTSSSSVTTSTSSSNSRILQLLNSKSPDGGGRRKTPPSVSKSFMCSQNPALADLLSKPPYHASTSVPPPVPTKWHQEPREKLPRDIMRKYLPPHPAERSKLNTESSPVNNCRPSVADTDHDPMLSEILDGVIDIQEKTPGSSRDIVQKRINLSDIEKFLSAAEVQQSVPTNQLYSPMVRQSSAGSGTPVPRINELLQVIPPNVTIPPNSEPSPYLLNVMSQRRSSRNHPPYDPTASFSTSSASHFSSHLPHSQPQQQHLHMHPQQQQQLTQQHGQMNPEGRQEGSSSSPMPSSKGGGGGGGSLLLQLLSE